MNKLRLRGGNSHIMFLPQFCFRELFSLIGNYTDETDSQSTLPSCPKGNVGLSPAILHLHGIIFIPVMVNTLKNSSISPFWRAVRGWDFSVHSGSCPRSRQPQLVSIECNEKMLINREMLSDLPQIALLVNCRVRIWSQYYLMSKPHATSQRLCIRGQVHVTSKSWLSLSLPTASSLYKILTPFLPCLSAHRDVAVIIALMQL